MTMRAVTGLILAVAFLACQTLGVAAHCGAIAGDAGHEHQTGSDAVSVQGAAEVAHGAGVNSGHSHSQPDGSADEFDFGLVTSDCSPGCVGVGPESTQLALLLHQSEALNPRPHPVPVAETVNLPTPPPNTIL